MTLGVTNEVNPKSKRALRKPRGSAASLGVSSPIAVADRSVSGRAVPASGGAAAKAAVAAGPNGSAVVLGPNGSAVVLGPKGSAFPKGSAAPAPYVSAGLTLNASVFPTPYVSAGLTPNASIFAAPYVS